MLYGVRPQVSRGWTWSSTKWHFVENWLRTEVSLILLEHFPSVVSEISLCLLGESPSLGFWAASSYQADIDSTWEGESAESMHFSFPCWRGCVLGCWPARAAAHALGTAHESEGLWAGQSCCGSDIKIVFPNSLRSDWATGTLEEGLPRAVMWREENRQVSPIDVIWLLRMCITITGTACSSEIFFLPMGKTLISISHFPKTVK